MTQFLDSIDVVNEAIERVRRNLTDSGQPIKLSALTDLVIRESDWGAVEEEVPEDAVPLAISLMQYSGEITVRTDGQVSLVRSFTQRPKAQPNELRMRRLRSEPRPLSGRSPGQIDRERILYSSEFQRLAGVTQVLPADSLLRMHNRLTHSLKVAYVAREIYSVMRADNPESTMLAEVDVDIVEACALAHDLGHPPFGHAAERVIQEEMQEHELPFEGNPQSFRIVTQLATGPLETGLRGLNLTRATLSGILKYPWMKLDPTNSHEKFGAYAEDSQHFEFARSGFPCNVSGPETPAAQKQRSVEAEIMDWADDVAYAIHDLEDFYIGRVIPFAMLAASAGEQERFLRSFRNRSRRLDPAHVNAAVGELFDVIAAKLRQPFDGTRLARANLREVTSDLTIRFLRAPQVATAPTNNEPSLVVIDPELRALAEVIKHLMFHYVIERPALATIQEGHAQAIRLILDYYLEAADPDPESDKARALMKRIPLTHALELRRAGALPALRKRAAVDAVAGMTDNEATALYHRLSGVDIGSLLDPITP